MPFAGILEILEPFLRGPVWHPEEALLHFGSRIFDMATSYPCISGNHLADHLIYLSLPFAVVVVALQLYHPSSSPPPCCHSTFHCCPRCAVHRHRRHRCRRAIHCRYCRRVAIAPCVARLCIPFSVPAILDPPFWGIPAFHSVLFLFAGFLFDVPAIPRVCSRNGIPFSFRSFLFLPSFHQGECWQVFREESVIIFLWNPLQFLPFLHTIQYDVYFWMYSF